MTENSDRRQRRDRGREGQYMKIQAESRKYGMPAIMSSGMSLREKLHSPGRRNQAQRVSPPPPAPVPRL